MYNQHKTHYMNQLNFQNKRIEIYKLFSEFETNFVIYLQLEDPISVVAYTGQTTHILLLSYHKSNNC